ncbi:MAG: hypothetical protein J5I81_01770 [Nitrococcus mobilis]|nr:hypothetical protein [Nitrococcus mobilis]
MNWIAWGYAALGFGVLILFVPGQRPLRLLYLAGVWAAALAVLVGSVQTLVTAASVQMAPAALAILPGFAFALDPMRALFLAVTALVFGLSIGFVSQESLRYTPHRARVLLGLTALLFATMVTILLAGAVLSLVFAWEVMSLVLWALVTFDSRTSQVVHAGHMTLAFSAAGALAALAGLLVLAEAAGTYSLAGIAAAAGQLPESVIWAGFLATFFGFGVKTGIVPVNAWMSDAYASAPRSLRPIFSGATLNLGVFTLWLIDGPLASHALWPALVVLVTGAVTAILGIVYALVARDLTRLLTHSSIENLGIVVAGLGAGFAFAALDRPVPAGMALVAGLYHMVNHSAYKTLLFLGAGGIESATGLSELNRLGGLMRRVPLFGTLFLLGTFAIAALPPFNGFVSEWLTLEALLRVVEVGAVPVRIVFALSGALLALTAGLALTCFVMLAGTTLLGLARSPEAAAVQSMSSGVIAPMVVLVCVCLGLGVLATGVIPVLAHLVAPVAGTDPAAALVPAFFQEPRALLAALVDELTAIGAQIGRGFLPLPGLVVLHSGGTATPVIFAMSMGLAFVVIAFLLVLVWGLVRAWRWRRLARRTLWDAGLARLQPEMTYTATAFAAPVRVLFDRVLRPVVAETAERHGAFVTTMRRDTAIVHVVDRLTLQPLLNAAQRLAVRLARMHHGPVTLYAAYIVGMTVVALLLVSAILA